MNASRDGGDNTRILHIDAPPPILRLVDRFCQSKGLQVNSTDSEAYGLHFALVKRYRAILLGAHSQRIDAGRILKGLVRARIGTPVFLITETPGKDAPLLERYPNVMGLIAKPLDPREIVRCLEFVARPPAFEPGERERILAMLGKWEKCLKHAD